MRSGECTLESALWSALVSECTLVSVLFLNFMSLFIVFHFLLLSVVLKLEAGGKPSTSVTAGRLVELP